jgi:putative addiction module component (TIGR02574 family)
MSQSPQQLLTEALEMPSADRGQLAAILIESLESDADDDGADEAWSDEISQRLQDIDAGRVRMIPWTEVRKRLRGQDAPAG